MKHEELMEDVKKVQKELAEEKEFVEKKKGPLIWIGSVLLALLVIMLVVPYYSIKLDPEPKYIPEINEVFSADNVIINNEDRNIANRAELLKFLEPNNPSVKQAADKIITLSKCPSNKICYAKALFYFVRKKINYVGDPPDEYVKTFEEMMTAPVGDCDDKSVLLANLLQSIGIYTRFVFVPNHVYVMAYIPESLKRYHDKEQFGWVNLDSTCAYCKFGETAYQYKDVQKAYI